MIKRIITLLVVSTMLGGTSYSSANSIAPNQQTSLITELNTSSYLTRQTAKTIALNSLSKQEKETLLPWKIEIVSKVNKVPPYIQTHDMELSSEIYKVTMYTTRDELLGPIGIYVDVEKNQVVGYEVRH